MPRHGKERIQSDLAPAGRRVAVAVAAARLHAVVEMHRAEAVQPDRPVKPLEHAVQIVPDVIPCGKHMAGIETHAEPIGAAGPVDQFRNLLKRTADLAALAGHGFDQQHRVRPHAGKHLFQQLGREAHAGLHPLPGMAAGMEIVQAARQQVQPFEIVLHGHRRKLPDARIRRAGVERVRRVRNGRPKTMLRLQRRERSRVRFIDRLCPAAARIARKKLKGVRADAQRVPPHFGKPAGGRQMTADVQHRRFSFPPPHRAWYTE